MTPANFNQRSEAQTPCGVGVIACDPELASRARTLAERLKLPFHRRNPLPRFLILVHHTHLGLCDSHANLGEIKADWTTSGIKRRVHEGRRQPLARAMGLHKRLDITVLDACAGLGRDGFTLASLGANVLMNERSPAIFALLEDAYHRALSEPDNSVWMRQRLTLHCVDTLEWLASGLNPNIDVVYLDPMYPPRRKAALPGKELQILRQLLGQDHDAAALLETALAHARHRVVVKRPTWAKPMRLHHAPAFSYAGSQVRYDVYLPANTAPAITRWNIIQRA